jgi:16S rRNA (guanine966-N2)-methyltransferase
MGKRGWVRIIGGRLRGRRLIVPEGANVRPTPDRVRVTVFNWLGPLLADANCLDLFAGTGVLGFEALSRGACYVEMVDTSVSVVKHLQLQLRQLGGGNVRIYRALVPSELPPITQPFDIVFLDPPYQANLLLPCCYYLEEQGYLAQLAHIYVEADRIIQDNELPSNWQIIKSKAAGLVAYHLVKRVAI